MNELIQGFKAQYFIPTTETVQTVFNLQNDLFFIQFNVPFKIISLIETSQSIGGANREYPGKTTRHTRKQNLSLSHVASAELEPTPDIAEG